MAQTLFEIFSPIIQKVNGASYATLNINPSNLTPSQVVQGVNIGNRQVVNAMNVQILGLKEFVVANAPSSGYSLPIASSSVLGGVKIGSGISIAGDGTISVSISGVVTAVSASSPLASSGGTTPNITISQANTSTNGYLSSTDWNTFNNKVTSLGAGTGISIGGTTTLPIVTNTAPDKTVVLSSGTGISVSGTYPNFTITNSSPSSGGTVTAVSIATNQGVSGSSSGGATPALTINLGALTGVTSFNGLVVTANTGVITSGTFQGTVISPTYGGTGVNNGSFALTIPATGTATLGTGAANRVTYWSGTNNVASSSSFIWDNTNRWLGIGNGLSGGVPTVSLDIRDSSTGNVTMQVINSSATASAQGVCLVLGSGNSGFVLAGRGGSFTNTNSLSKPLSAILQSSAAATNGIVIFTVADAPIIFGYNTSTESWRIAATNGYLSNTGANGTSNLQVAGSIANSISAKTANYTLTASDYTVTFNGTSLTATLPSAGSCGGRIYCIVNYNATTLTISAFLNYSSASTTSVGGNSAIKIQSDGSVWRQIV